ncbi:inactive tyrosine-protein kinase 7-like [Clytia hemisphaerica]|uniref:receptor protein-tyrosine kinase n=1 Tax=Clytia hemisphaerica TaxID=252671 RepID=A0A7M5UA89_9CNID
MFITSIFLVALFSNANALTVQLSKSSAVAAVDSTLLVDCVTNPTDGVNVYWEKGGEAVPLQPTSGKEPEFFYMSNNTLKITKVKRRHAGTYSCFAKHKTEFRFAEFKVEIMYIQQANPLEPRKTYSGVEVEMQCIPPLGKPNPKPLWLKDGKTFSDPRVDQSTFTLKISKTQLSDTANYTCVSMGYKNRTTTASLTVYEKGPFSVKPEKINATEGDKVEFKCISGTKPPLPLKWFKRNKQCDDKGCKTLDEDVDLMSDVRFVKTDDGVLTITKVKPEDKADYVCTRFLGATTEEAVVKLHVITLIKIDLKPKASIDIDSTKPHTVACPYQGVNPKSISWIRKDTGALPSHMNVDGSTLVITKPQLSDSGVYTCKIVGPLNSDEATVNLTMYKGLKFIKRPSNITGFVSKPLWIDCVGSGYPEPWVFYFRIGKGGGELNSTYFTTHKNGTLYIPKLRKEDQGKYMCILKNDPGGSKTSQFELTVKSENEKAGASSPMHRTIGIAVGCAGVYILLVIGLMIYCRARRARLLKGIITEVDGEGKDPLIGNGNKDIPLDDMKKFSQWEYKRSGLEEIGTLGHGKMGRVYKANAVDIRPSEKRTLVAVKEFNSDEKEHKDEFNIEMEMFTQLDHINVVKLLGVCMNASPPDPWLLITDFGEEGDLKGYLDRNKNLSIHERLDMSMCVANGMDYLIAQHYMHRDLAARNCVVRANKSVSISFLSLCEDTYKDDYFSLNDYPVPLRWLSPECIQEENYSEKSDVWSFGITVWEIFSNGDRPYANFDNDAVLKGVCLDLRLTKPKDCPDSIFHIMESCWLKEASERPSFADLKSAINDVKID